LRLLLKYNTLGRLRLISLDDGYNSSVFTALYVIDMISATGLTVHNRNGSLEIVLTNLETEHTI
jgi:hypothetical protein